MRGRARQACPPLGSTIISISIKLKLPGADILQAGAVQERQELEELGLGLELELELERELE